MAHRFLWYFWAFISGARADEGDDGLSDFSNDLATDLAPLLTLFGEAITKQYLSESTSFLDYLIFAMGPIGVLTAMVSTIRVCGHSSLRAFIGRSQEGEATVEAELCTSTSRDVCELFNRGGIARVLGRPNVLELVYNPLIYHEKDCDDSVLNLSRMFFERASEFSGSSIGWERTKGNEKVSADEIAPNPNLSLNVGIVKRPRWVYIAIAVTGIILQAGVLVLAGIGVWVLGWNLNGGRTSTTKHYAPVMFITGTTLMCLGMWGCAYLIGQTTEEVRFQRKPMHRHDPKLKPRLFWLQPGPQVIGDQSFDPFGYAEDPANPLQVWTSSRKEFQDTFELRTYFAVLAVLIGYIAQFIGLRGMKAWVSLAQLGVCIVMSILRGCLRMQRLDKNSNQLADKLDIVSGHELDWLSYQIVLQKFEWAVYPRSVESLEKNSGHDEHSTPRTSTDSYPTEEDAVSLHNLLTVRKRLAQLTGLAPPYEILNSKCQRWTDGSVKVRAMARKMSAAICQVAEKHLPKSSRSEYSLLIPMVAYNPRRNDHCRTELHLRLRLGRQDTWEIDPADLEAILGLWLWEVVDDSILKGHDPGRRNDTPVYRIISLTPDLENVEDYIANRIAEITFWCDHFVGFEDVILRLEGQPWYSAKCLWDTGSNGQFHRLQKGMPASVIFTRRYCGWTSVSENIQPGCKGEFRALTVQSFSTDTFDIVAQDLLTVLLVSLTRDITFGETKLVVQDGPVHPSNLTVNDMVDAFAECGLPAGRDAWLCIIPALRERLPLPEPQDLLDAILDTMDRETYISTAVSWLTWSCVQFNSLQGEESRIFEQTLRAVGEVYRTSVRNRRLIAMVSHFDGDELVGWMRRNYGSRAQHDLVVREILVCYWSIKQRLDRIPGTKVYPEKDENEKKETHLNLLQALEDGDRTETLYRLCFIGPDAFRSEALQPALSLAVRNDWAEVIRDMLDLKADPNSRDQNGRSAISHAAELGLEQHLKTLIKHGADMDLPDNKQQTPLHYAAENGQERIVKILVDHGTVDIHRTNKDGHNALWIASKHGHKAIMEDLLKRGVSPDCRKGEYDQAPFFYTASHGYTALALDMVDRMSKWEDVETGGELLAVAEARGYTELIDKLRGKVTNVS
ncbi:hypothetical protein CEP52_002998 [Fusarium oligoseptatum]|uniref:Uncharacterized protein n=1 Tax=Fusarium oligoseptatum TaxID=2604345 RepID=A0A428UAT3_9HYPO|nr:hypothetical protein CEP52_002998 [Fusarium oligoseptatum]